MIALGASDVETTDVESGDDEETFDEEMTHSYKVMYEKLVDVVNENKGLLKQMLQLCREKNELVKQVNVLKDEFLKQGDSLKELELIKKTMLMMNSDTIDLDHIMLMGRTTKDHKGLGFTEERSDTKPYALTNAITIGRNYHHKGGRKNHSSRRQRLRCYYCKKLRLIRRECSHFLMHQKVRQQKQHPKTNIFGW